MRMFRKAAVAAMSRLSGSLTNPGVSATVGYLIVTPGVFWAGTPTTPSSGYVSSKIYDISSWKAGLPPSSMFSSCYAQINNNTLPYRSRWMSGGPINPILMYVPCSQENYSSVSAALSNYLIVQQTTAGTDATGTGPLVDSGLGVTFTLTLRAWGGASGASSTTYMFASHN